MKTFLWVPPLLVPDRARSNVNSRLFNVPVPPFPCGSYCVREQVQGAELCSTTNWNLICEDDTCTDLTVLSQCGVLLHMCSHCVFCVPHTDQVYRLHSEETVSTHTRHHSEVWGIQWWADNTAAGQWLQWWSERHTTTALRISSQEACKLYTFPHSFEIRKLRGHGH